MSFGIPCRTSYIHVLIVGDMNSKNLKLSSLALFFRRKESSKSWRIIIPWWWLSSMHGNTSSLLILTPLYSCNLSTSSEISAVIKLSSKATPYFISFGSLKNSPWLHTCTSCCFSFFELGICVIDFMISSRDCAWLIAIWRFDESLLVDCFSIGSCWCGFPLSFVR